MYIVLGACVGVIIGLTGVGGGSLMTPALILLFGIHPATAVGTDLLYAATTKSAGAAVHGAQGNVAWPVVAWLALGSVPASAATIALLAVLGGHSGFTAKAMTFVLGLTLLATAVLMLFRRRLLRLRMRLPALGPERTALLTLLVGAVVGVLVSISSVGAGAIAVTALLLLYPEFPIVRIVGTDIAHAVPLTLVAGLGHWLTGSVDAAMLVSLLMGSIPGIVAGSYLAPKIPERGLRILLSAVLALAGFKLVVP